ncbi:basic proline-rich protein-like [Molothrus ater]|uniref:basic proline-rich protein-like n=1 Tax=Molothrus ater TaxID=84834 RepID=UPI00174B522F|nr:basic proline-rich protein-like [Molothrus ater]
MRSTRDPAGRGCGTGSSTRRPGRVSGGRGDAPRRAPRADNRAGTCAPRAHWAATAPRRQHRPIGGRRAPPPRYVTAGPSRGSARGCTWPRRARRDPRPTAPGPPARPHRRVSPPRVPLLRPCPPGPLHRPGSHYPGPARRVRSTAPGPTAPGPTTPAQPAGSHRPGSHYPGPARRVRSTAPGPTAPGPPARPHCPGSHYPGPARRVRPTAPARPTGSFAPAGSQRLPRRRRRPPPLAASGPSRRAGSRCGDRRRLIEQPGNDRGAPAAALPRSTER